MICLAFALVKLLCGMEGTISWHLLKCCLSLCKGVATGPSLNALDILYRYWNIRNCRWIK